MKNIFMFLLLVFIGGQFLWGQPANLVWNTQSRNASESMPCGGGDGAAAQQPELAPLGMEQPEAGDAVAGVDAQNFHSPPRMMRTY